MKKTILLTVFLFSSFSLFSQMVTEMEFRNQPIKDILLVLAQVSSQSVIPDETVVGNATYVFYNMPFEEALYQFLDNFGLYANKKNGVYHISRVGVDYNKESGLVSLKTEGEDIQKIIKILSEAIGKTVLYDALPRESLSLQFEGGNPEALLNTIIRKYSDYSLEVKDDYFYIKRETADSGQVNNYGGVFFQKDDQLYSARLKQARFKDVLTDLMMKEGLEFTYLGRNDAILERFVFSGKTFEQMLELLTDQGSVGYQSMQGIYYFYDRDREDILDRFQSSLRLELQSLSCDNVMALLPSSLINGVDLKIDVKTNSLIVTGTLDAVAPLENYLMHLDQGNREYDWARYDLVFLKASEIAGLLPDRFKNIPRIILSEGNAILLFIKKEAYRDIESYLAIIDRPVQVYPISLNYIQGEELIASLPPFVDESEISLSHDSNMVYFTGRREKYEEIMHSLEAIDKPRPQIRYEILVLQVRDVDQLDWDFSFGSEIMQEGTQTALTGSLGSVLNLNFDIISQFGYQFAAKLNMALNQADARIMADTTLYGLSGEKIQFRNTGTSRYYALTYDEDGNVSDDKSIKEISSGILIDLEGWVSGDGMITMEIGSTISKQSSVDSSSSNALPSTTEKVISTNVRTPSGEPIIITGLKQQDKSLSVSKIPFLGDIPLLGLLFQKRQEEIENSDFYVTVVPHLEYWEEDRGISFYQDAFQKLVEGND